MPFIMENMGKLMDLQIKIRFSTFYPKVDISKFKSLKYVSGEYNFILNTLPPPLLETF